MTVYVDTCEGCGYRHPKGDCADQLAALNEQMREERDEARELARYLLGELGREHYGDNLDRRCPWLKEKAGG